MSRAEFKTFHYIIACASCRHPRPRGIVDVERQLWWRGSWAGSEGYACPHFVILATRRMRGVIWLCGDETSVELIVQITKMWEFSWKVVWVFEVATSELLNRESCEITTMHRVSFTTTINLNSSFFWFHTFDREIVAFCFPLFCVIFISDPVFSAADYFLRSFFIS